jgi:metallophosphoesterase (TIGR03767 family)
MRSKIGAGLAALAVVTAGTAGVSAATAQAASPEGFTTVDRSVVAGGPLDPAKPRFLTVQQGGGWARVVRELVPGQAQAGRDTRRGSLTYFAQLSDFQLADEESPARVEFSDNLASSLNAAWRPQEAFDPHTVDSAIRQVNRFTAASPVAQAGGARAQMDFALTTGDNADNQQYNENVWVRQLLEGGTSLTPNSGVKSNYNECSAISDAALTLRDLLGERNEPIYTGVQDFRDQSADTRTFYDPNQPQGTYADWPRWTGLMDRAQQAFTPAGLRRGAAAVPSYVANGNHDGLVQGNQASLSAIEGIALGCFKPLVPSLDFSSIISALTGAFVRPDANRRHLDKAQVKAVYAGGAQADGHGFGLVSAAENTASRGAASYYAWDPKPGVRFIALDTISEGGVIAISADGNIDNPQFTWLTNEIVAAEAARKLVVVFGHHPIRSLTASVTDELAPACTVRDSHGHDVNPGCDRDPRSSAPVRLGANLQALLNAHPNVIAYVTGHTHENRVMACGNTSGCPAGANWWELNTASEIDWPQESRLIEVMDNRDGTLSLFGTLLDNASSYTPPAAGSASAFTPDQLAAIGRTLSYNDPQAALGAIGQPADRNVELLVRDPR